MTRYLLSMSKGIITKKVQQEVVLRSNLLVEQVGFEPLIEIVVCYLTPAGQSYSFLGCL